MTRAHAAAHLAGASPGLPLIAAPRPAAIRRNQRPLPVHRPAVPRQRGPGGPDAARRGAGDAAASGDTAGAAARSAPVGAAPGAGSAPATLAAPVLPVVERFRWLREYPPGMFGLLFGRDRPPHE